jgi:hypothetical protein
MQELEAVREKLQADVAKQLQIFRTTSQVRSQ